MIPSIHLPSTSFYNYLTEPFIEGALRIKIAWTGRDLSGNNSLSLKDRSVILLKGALLIIPLVNAMIWVAMQRFGEQKLNRQIPPESPHIPIPPPTRAERKELVIKPPPSLTTPSPSPPPVPPRCTKPRRLLESAPTILATPAPVAAVTEICAQPRIETFKHQETVGKHTFESTWTVTYGATEIRVNKKSSFNNSDSVYDLDWRLLSITDSNENINYNYTFTAILQPDKTHIEVRATSFNGKTSIPIKDGVKKNKQGHIAIPDGHIWMQQNVFGLKDVLKSGSIQFFMLSPLTPKSFTDLTNRTIGLHKGTARKTEKSRMSDDIQLVEVTSTIAIPLPLKDTSITTTCWIDEKDGTIREANCPSWEFLSLTIIPKNSENRLLSQ